MTDRSRLIFCSVVVRDRILSFSSRRPLHPMATRDKWLRPDREDFGLEICLPRYGDRVARNELVKSFLSLCGLSEILCDMILFEQDRLKRPSKAEISRQDVLRVSQLDIRLREWKRGFQIWKDGPSVAPLAPIHNGKGSMFLRRIVAESVTCKKNTQYPWIANEKTDLLLPPCSSVFWTRNREGIQ
jgi:hypothetical protein